MLTHTGIMAAEFCKEQEDFTGAQKLAQLKVGGTGEQAVQRTQRLKI